MIKEDIVREIAKDTGLSGYTASLVVESLLKNITFALSKGDKVQFSGFGTFESKKRAARTGRNPHIGQAVPIPERFMPVFTPGTKLKNAVTESKVLKGRV